MTSDTYARQESVATLTRIAKASPKRPGLIVADWVEGCRAQGIELTLEEIVELVAVVGAAQRNS